MFISPAYAQPLADGSDFIIQLVPILLMFVIFYLLLLRPQQQKVKAAPRDGRQLAARRYRRHLRRHRRQGDEGARRSDEIEVEIAENTRVRVIRGTVTEVRVKGEPVKETA